MKNTNDTAATEVIIVLLFLFSLFFNVSSFSWKFGLETDFWLFLLELFAGFAPFFGILENPRYSVWGVKLSFHVWLTLSDGGFREILNVLNRCFDNQPLSPYLHVLFLQRHFRHFKLILELISVSYNFRHFFPKSSLSQLFFPQLFLKSSTSNSSHNMPQLQLVRTTRNIVKYHKTDWSSADKLGRKNVFNNLFSFSNT